MMIVSAVRTLNEDAQYGRKATITPAAIQGDKE